MMFQTINSLDELNSTFQNNVAVLTYFSTTECNVCKVLKPKVEELFTSDFPQVKLVYVETNLSPEVAAQNRIFAVPTIIIFFDGKEFIRKSRSFGIDELKNEIIRPYSIMFE